MSLLRQASSPLAPLNALLAPIFPGAAIFIAVIAYYLVGEGLRDALAPRLK